MLDYKVAMDNVLPLILLKVGTGRFPQTYIMKWQTDIANWMKYKIGTRK